MKKIISLVVILTLVLGSFCTSFATAQTNQNEPINQKSDLISILNTLENNGEIESLKKLNKNTYQVQFDKETTDIITKNNLDDCKIEYTIVEDDITDVLVIDTETGARYLNGSKVIYTDEYDVSNVQNTFSSVNQSSERNDPNVSVSDSILRMPTTMYSMTPFWNASRDDFEALESTRYSNIYTDSLIADASVAAVLGIIAGVGIAGLSWWAGAANGTVVGIIKDLISAYKFNEVGDANRIFFKQTRWQWDNNTTNLHQWKNAQHWLDNNRGNVLTDVEPAIEYEALML